MADLSATYTMSTDPAIKHTVSYQSYRSGTTIYYRFRVSIAPIYGSQYFGYNLLASLNLNGSAVATDFTLKSASPNRWTSAIVVYLPSSSGWYSVSGIKTASTISASISFRSSQTHGTASSGNRTVNVPSAAAPKAPAVSLSTTTVLPSGTVRIGASGASWQSATTLSGGEAQRVKLATELSKRSTGKTIYILDEPTTGLHTADVHRLVNVLNMLVDTGNTVVVIEHNLDIIKNADHIIDLGPEGGKGGGKIVAAGTPEEIAKCKKSYTGQYLKKYLQ